ncbi:uncharacterized protein LOC131940485 [Physella acuta]|uniref:uncharacterized protein LOC131940485 n=1 Tax=Physella acuta TaxID=109671 RepID=UPI0027DC9849|nr:uncharacterized protein LOC131940485 [Physella acuta]
MDTPTLVPSTGNQNTSGSQTTLKVTVWQGVGPDLLEIIIDQWVNLLVCLIGIVANIIEICVFTKQGFKDTVNISMTFIAFWDLLRVTFGACQRLHGPISFFSPTFATVWQNYTLFKLSYIHNISSNISYLLGAYIALERCLCVGMPLQVKFIITVKVTIAVCAIISIVVFSSLFPLFFIYEPAWVYNENSKTFVFVNQVTEFYRTYGARYVEASAPLGFLYPTLSLTIMVTSTLIIWYHLHKSTSCRSNQVSNYIKFQPPLDKKEKQVLKMLLVIIYIYILNLIPRVTNYIAKMLNVQYYNGNFIKTPYWIIVYLAYLLDFVNSTVHLFVFYAMSSKFKNTFRRIFCSKY